MGSLDLAFFFGWRLLEEHYRPSASAASNCQLVGERLKFGHLGRGHRRVVVAASARIFGVRLQLDWRMVDVTKTSVLALDEVSVYSVLGIFLRPPGERLPILEMMTSV